MEDLIFEAQKIKYFYYEKNLFYYRTCCDGCCG